MHIKREAHSAWTRPDLFALSALLATVACVVFYIVFESRADLHSDSALKSVLAAVATEELRLVPRGWIFANGDTLIATPYTLLIPLQGMFGLSFETNATATVLCFIMMLGAVCFLADTILPKPKPKALALSACALAACTLSAANLEFTAAQGAYSLYAALALPFFAILIRSSAPSMKWALFLLAFILTANNPTRAWVSIFFPAILAVLALEVLPALKQPGNWRASLSAFKDYPVLALGVLAGHITYSFAIVPGMHNFDAVANVAPASLERMLYVAGRLPSDWFTYFELGGAWKDLSIADRILQMSAWLIACLILLVPGAVILSRRCPRDLKHAAWLAYALLASGLVPLIVVDKLYQGPMEIRYATLGILVGLTLVPAAFYCHLKGKHFSSFQWVTTFLLVFSFITSFTWHTRTDPSHPDVHGRSLQQRMALIDILVENEVGTAVATYWNSHVISVLSSGKTMVSPISYQGRLTLFAHHVATSPLHGTAGAAEAVIFADEEMTQGNVEIIVNQLGEPKSKLTTSGFSVWLYDKGTVDEIFAVGHRFDYPVQASAVSIESSTAAPVCSTDGCTVRLQVKNTGNATLASVGRVPMRVGLRGLGSDGSLVADLGRIDFQMPMRPGETDNISTSIAMIPEGVASVQACLLQEDVQWLCDRTGQGPDPALAKLDKPADPSDVRVEISDVGLNACSVQDGLPCHTKMTVRNSGKLAINGPGSMPLRIGYRAHRPVTAGGGTTEGRLEIPLPLLPGEEINVPIVLDPRDAGLNFQVCVLQENVAWLCDRTEVRISRGRMSSNDH